MEANELKDIVREKYGAIAVNAVVRGGCSCGCGSTAPKFPNIDYTIMADEYRDKEGYVESADLGLGCGLPLDYLNLQAGETVLDLGSGAGNDCFIARKFVGETGEVIGLDMTEEMVYLAKQNAQKLGFGNMRFILGEIEDMPVASDSIDAILSNCVLNLVPDKRKAFAEMYRVLKSGGRFTVSDIVLNGELPENIKTAAVMYAGCVAGALRKEDYIEGIAAAGFKDVEIRTSKPITLPDEFLSRFVSGDEFERMKSEKALIESVTIFGRK